MAWWRSSHDAKRVVDAKMVCVPNYVCDLTSFRRWVHSDDFPAEGRISYLRGEVRVDISKEQFVHNQIKGEVAAVLTRLVKQQRLGQFFPDGYLLSNVAADLSTNPDGIFASTKSLQDGKARLVEGAEEGHVELEGSPDMVQEVISPNTRDKDTGDLRELYWKASIAEYWLIDPWAKRLDFQVLRHSARGYVSVRRQGGWLRSSVFNKSFQLTERLDEMGFPEYTLAMR